MGSRVGFALVVLAGLLIFGWAYSKDEPKAEQGKEGVTNQMNGRLQTATFAGGCFWCTQADFEKVPGVVRVTAGYTGGHTENPTYEEVSAGGTGHVEAVQVVFDPEKLSYKQLLDYFWRHVDPTDPGGQFVDRGPQYRSVIFYHDEEQKRLAEESKKELEASGHFTKPIVTEILPFTKFYPAEEYHRTITRRTRFGTSSIGGIRVAISF
jgi:peptide methionine sulfoxide reductase msrA/msrB